MTLTRLRFTPAVFWFVSILVLMCAVAWAATVAGYQAATPPAPAPALSAQAPAQAVANLRPMFLAAPDVASAAQYRAWARGVATDLATSNAEQDPVMGAAARMLAQDLARVAQAPASELAALDRRVQVHWGMLAGLARP